MEEKKTRTAGWLASRALALVSAAAVTLALFLVLPLLQAIGNPLRGTLDVRDVAVMAPPEPEPAPEEEVEEEEPPPPPPPPKMAEAPPLDLSQLEIALNPGGFGAGTGGDFAIDIADQLGTGPGGGEEMDRIFSLQELDQRPRPIFRRKPVYPANKRRSGATGTVEIIFIVDEQGRVVQPKVHGSTDPVFEQAALDAVRQWRFEPGTRQGEKVQFKMKVPITFNAAG